MANRWHVGWLKEGVKPWNARRKKIGFTPDLKDFDFSEILPVDFRDSPKASRFFEKIDLSAADLQGANLSNLNFQRAVFNKADLSHAKMDASNFKYAKFDEANLTDASAQRSVFRSASFTLTQLNGVDFEGSDVENVEFIEAPLSERQVKDLENQGNYTRIASLNEFRIMKSADRVSDEILLSSSPERPKVEKVPKYDVFYGTNRKPNYTLGKLEGYGDVSDNKINYGVCEVIIPESHKVGTLGSPRWKRVLKRVDDRLRIHQIVGLNSHLYWAYIKSLSDKMKQKEKPTIFVHGFNNSFEDAVLRTAQIGHDLGIGQGMGLFSWPSSASVTKYAADEATSESSKYLLANFIEEFVNNTEINGVNIIAHSMGCRCLLGAIEVLSHERQPVIQKINQVILAAADVDARHMDVLGQHTINNCTRTTSYVAAQDDALRISRWLHDYPRVGIIPPTYLLKGMDTVLVNNSDLGRFGHGYVASSRAILSDIFDLLKYNSNPSDRYSVELVNVDVLEYWKIRE